VIFWGAALIGLMMKLRLKFCLMVATSPVRQVKRRKLSHRRRFYMSIEGNDIRGEDSLFVPLGRVPLSNAEIPKAGWRFRTDGGPLTLEDSVYLGAGHKPVKCQQIVIAGRAFCDSDGETRSNRVRWSFRKLEARK